MPLGQYDGYGGQYVPETLMPALAELEKEYNRLRSDPGYKAELHSLLTEYAGRPTSLYYAGNLSKKLGVEAYLKREDLVHGGAHKLNNTLGQVLLARHMGKKRVIAETGAGQHGVATAICCACLGLSCEVYMGAEDIERQKLNVFRMELLGAKVHTVNSGTKTLKDATNEALRDWLANVYDTYYCIGSVVGPHPYPKLVKEFQSIISAESKKQFAKKEGGLPDAIIACVGGGSNAMGSFASYMKEESVALIGVEAAGEGVNTKRHGATLSKGRDGVLHGSLSKLLQDSDGQVMESHSISAGLDYPGVGPELSALEASGRLRAEYATDAETIKAVKLLCETEGILPALESAHAIAYLVRDRKRLAGQKVIVTVSGRGDKDVHTIGDYLGVRL